MVIQVASYKVCWFQHLIRYMENNEVVSEVLYFAAITWIPVAKGIVDKQYHLALYCHKLEYVAYDVDDCEDVGYVVVDVEDEIDDVEFDYEIANAIHEKEYDDGESRELVDVLELIVDDVVNDVIGNEIAVLVVRDVAVINYFRN